MEQNVITFAPSAATRAPEAIATSVAGTTDSAPLTAAQLMEEHERAAAAGASAEDAPAETATTTAAAVAAAPKSMKPAAQDAPALDFNSAEAFPSLGGPAPVKPVVPPTWGSKMPAAVATPVYTNGSAKSALKATGHIKKEITNILELQEHQKISRNQLKKPMADIGKDIEKKTNTRIQMSTTGAGVTVIIIKGQEAYVAIARRELQRELCPKRTITISIPTFVRSYIIGKGGENIKRLQQETQTKINVPKMLEGEVPIHEDDGTTIDITVDGDAEGCEIAKRKIDAIVAEKTAHTVIRIHDIHGKFYPFIAGAYDQTLKELQQGKEIRIEVPDYYVSATSELAPASGPIVIRGEKVAANDAKAAIEALVKELSSTFATIPVTVHKSHHKFLVGDHGRGIHKILEKSGCSIVVPPLDKMINSLVVTGPSDKIGNGVSEVMAISKSYYTITLPLHRAHANSPIGASAHARALVRLWQKNGDLKPIETAHDVEIEFPKVLGENIPVEIIARSEQARDAAKDQFKQLTSLYSPPRVDSLKIDPLCHPTILGKDGRGLKQFLEKYGVHVLMGEKESYGDEVFLVADDTSITEENAKEKFKEVKDLLEQQAKGLGDIISEKLTIPAKFYVVISDGSTFRALSQGNVSVNHTAPEGEDAGDITVTVRGPSADVKSTVKKINDWVEKTKDQEDLKKQHVIIFDYPAQYSAMLIGTKGANVNKLRDELGVDIKLKEGKGEIKGIQVNAEVARRRLNEQIKQLEDNTILRIQVPPEHHKTIIGAQGKFVRRLEEKYGVRINFPKSGKEEESQDGTTEGAPQHARQLAADEVMIKGGKKGCAEARSEIEELLKYEIEHGQTATVKIAAKCIKGLFTTYMREFKRIREESGARIEIPNEGDSAPETILEIRIKGTKEAVATAKKDMTKIVNDLDQLTVERITVDKKYHRALIGTGGATLRDIVEKAGGPMDRSAQARMVRFPGAESQDDVIKIEGNRNVVEKIIAAINKIVEEKQNQIQEIVDVPREKHAMLIGRGGSIRQELEGRFKVTIDIPRQNETEPTQSGVTLTGLPEDVATAKAHIIELTKEVEGETVNVPSYLYHAVADGGLFIRRLKNDLRVTVDHAGHALPPRPTTAEKPTSTSLPLITDPDHDESSAFSWEVIDDPAIEGNSETTGDIPWVLRTNSNAENIQTAKDLIMRQIDLAKEQTYIGYLTLPDTSKYRHVVGRNGSEINRIKEATNCRISVPKGGEGDAIVIWGSKEGVERAKEIIMETVANAGESREGWNGGRRGRGD